MTYHVDYLPLFNMIADRFRSIRDELGLKVDIETDLAKMRDSLPEMSVDEIVSRGEYFTSRLMADYLGSPLSTPPTLSASTSTAPSTSTKPPNASRKSSRSTTAS